MNFGAQVNRKGELARILAMVQKKTAAGDVARGRLVQQIKMVAGTRNHRESTPKINT